MPEPTAEPKDAVARFAALLAPEGQELLGRLREAGGSATDLRLGMELRAAYPVDLVVDALAQHELRLRARAKFSRAMDMFFTRAGLEQASAEVIAGHRLARYTGAGLVADLCCGIGGDLTALAAGRRVLAVDRDPLHLRMALANAGAYGVAAGITALAADVREVSLGGVVGSGLAERGVDAAFIDPARRAGQRRLRAGDSEPPLDWCIALAETVERTGIKAAPGLPRDAVPPAWELEFIAVGRDLKEAVAWSPALATAASRATILPGGHTLTPGTGAPVPVREPAGFLLDPSPAVTRAGGGRGPGPPGGRLEDRRADRLPVRRHRGAYPVRPDAPGDRLGAVAPAQPPRPAACPGRGGGGHPPARAGRRRRRTAPPATADRVAPGHAGDDQGQGPALGAGLRGCPRAVGRVP
jgi:predicted RNA methylase